MDVAEAMKLLGFMTKAQDRFLFVCFVLFSLPTAIVIARVLAFFVPVSQVLMPTGYCEVDQMTLAYTVGCLTGEEHRA